MLEVGWSEILVIALILIIVVGPKDLPGMLRTFGQMASRVRKMANEFKGQFDEALREAELDDVRKGLSEVNKLNPTSSLRDAMNPIRKLGQDIKSDLNKASDFAQKPDDATKIAAMSADPVVAPTPVASTPAVSTPVVTPQAVTVPTPEIAVPIPPTVDPVPATAKPRATRKKADYVPVEQIESTVSQTPRASRRKVAVVTPDAATASEVAIDEDVKRKPAPRKRSAKTGEA